MSGHLTFPTILPSLSIIGRGVGAGCKKATERANAVTCQSQNQAQRQKSQSVENLRPYHVIKRRRGTSDLLPKPVPSHIVCPDYATQDQRVSEKTLFKAEESIVWTEEEINLIRNCCQISRRAVQKIERLIQPGITTKQLDEEIHEEIIKNHAYPSVLKFEGFPGSSLTSVNNIINGVPDDLPLQDGDILTIDCSVFYDGFHGGSARTFSVGQNLDREGRHLVSAALECLHAGVAACGPKVPFTHIASDIMRLATRRRVGVVRALAGHGIGREFQCSPDVYHGLNSIAGTMKPGHVFTVEPCVTEGAPLVRNMEGCNHTLKTSDDWRAAQFQHTVAITEYGVDILSL